MSGPRVRLAQVEGSLMWPPPTRDDQCIGAMATAPPLVGYRPGHAPLLAGAWAGGELLCFADDEARRAGVRTVAPEPGGGSDWTPRRRLMILPEVGFVRFTEIEGVHRRARLEIGIQGEFDAAAAARVLALARDSAFGDLNLNRVYGWVRATQAPVLALLPGAGFAPEAAVPAGARVDGRLVDRRLWGALRSEWS